MKQQRKIGFIGAGNMTRAIVRGLCSDGISPDNIMVSNRSEGKLHALAEQYGVQTTLNNVACMAFADVVLLSVKPQLMPAVCQQLVASGNVDNKLFVSIAAGISVARLSELLGGHENIVRTMPNTPSAVGMGLTGIYPHTSTSQQDVDFVTELMAAVGQTIVVEREALIDTVTAACGSSPAYFMYILEAMQQETVAQGFSQDDARMLVEQAMIGSALLIRNQRHEPLDELRRQVTSKGGTTAAALDHFHQQGLNKVIRQGMAKAKLRAEQIAGEY